MRATSTKAALFAAILAMNIHSLLCQTATSRPTPMAMDVPQFRAHAAPIPKLLVYQHFLAMVNSLDKKATESGETDPYKFAQPFVGAGMEHADLDILRSEARALLSGLAAHDGKAKIVIAAYRERAKTAAQIGQPLPPVPRELTTLQAARNAIAANHVISLQSNLGKVKTLRLEGYFKREFTPRVSLKVLAHPPANVSASSPAQGFTAQSK